MSLGRWNYDLVSSLARRYGTPLWVFDVDLARTLISAIRGDISQQVRVELPYKAIGCSLALKELMDSVDGIMVNSITQAANLVNAGIKPSRITLWVSSSNPQELWAACHLGIGRIVVDDAAIVETILRTESNIINIDGCLLRVRSEGSMANPYNRFGVSLPDAVYLLRRLMGSWHGGIGLAYHADVMQSDPTIWQEPRIRLLEALLQLQPRGRYLSLDIGGGLPPISLQTSTMKSYLTPFVGHDGIHVSVCLGRAVLSDAGIVISRITSIRKIEGNLFILVDAGANLLIPLSSASFKARVYRDGQSSICSVADSFTSYGVFEKEAHLPVDALSAGDLLYFERAGTYTWSMRSGAVQSAGTGVVINSTGEVLARET